MDTYTTSFTYPRPNPPTRHTGAASSNPLFSPPATGGSADPGSEATTDPTPTVPLPNVTTASNPAPKPSAEAVTTPAQVEKDWKAVQQLAKDIMARDSCHVVVTKETIDAELGAADPSPAGNAEPDEPIQATTSWNFHISGPYQSVMNSRGAILRDVPRDNRTVLKVARSEILEPPATGAGAGASPSPLKADVKRRLDEIATESRAFIRVVNGENGGAGAGGTVLAQSDGQEVKSAPLAKTGSADANGSGAEGAQNGEAGESASAPASGTAGAPVQGAPSTYGLETEKTCDLVITGPVESVELAKLRLLVMLDELSGLVSDICDIDYKLHAIIAGRKRGMIQQIQEETATNIYFPTPLVGVLNPPQPGVQQGMGYRHINPSMTGTSSLPMHMTGMSTMTSMSGMHGGHAPGPGMGMDGMPMHMTGGMNGNYPHPHAPHQHQAHQHQHQHGPSPNRGNAPPVYNPHQHVHYPYQPQPLSIDPSTTRGMPYSGPTGMQYPMHHGPPPPMSVNHTGMSSMHTGFQSIPGSRMGSPMPPNMHPQHPHHPMGSMGLAMSGVPGPHQHGAPMGMAPGAMSMGGPRGPTPHQQQHHAHGHAQQHVPPFQAHNGQSHLHVGMGGGPMGPGMGMHGGMAGGMPGGVGAGVGGMQGGMGMQPGMGQFGAGLHPGLSVHGGEQGLLGKANQIWITGEFFGVQRARDMLLNVALQKSKLVISRDTAILPRKLDWLLTERLEEVKAIMNDNGTYIQVPSAGTQASLITVFGDHRVNIERTIRSVMALACQFYIASFWLLPIAFDVLMPQAALNTAQMQPVLKTIAHATGAEVVFKSNCFEMHGLEAAVRAAVLMVMDLELIRNFHHEIRFQIELANEHREFISGKKNGKINKIMKAANVKIKFETFNDYNFLMDIAGSDQGALQGLGMLQEELPAEVSFHVPESYHKRIIGVGGKNIQRIMKNHGVYVKFSNAEEFAALGGYIDNEDNVVARTPAKNAINLENLRAAVMELVNARDKDYTEQNVSIPRRYHRTLLGEKSIFIHDIEQKTNSIVRFPYKETASDIVTIFGPDSQVHIAAKMLLEHVPFEADLHVPPNPELKTLVATPEFIVFTEGIKREHQISISGPKFEGGDETVFKFRCQRSVIDLLGAAREALEEWLRERNVQVYPSNAARRVDSFTDTFTHFHSKILAPGNNNSEAEGETLADRRTRPPSDNAQDVRALFNRHGRGYIPTDESSLGFAGPLYQDPRRTSDLWTGPSPQQPAPQTTRTESDHQKRDSDPIVNDRIRQTSAGHTGPGSGGARNQHPHSGPRIVSGRHQSLDISQLNFSRALTGGPSAFGPMPPSPTAATSSPNTASGPYFPHVGPHPIRANVTGRGGYGGVGSRTGGVDDVTEAMSNVHVSHQPHQSLQ